MLGIETDAAMLLAKDAVIGKARLDQGAQDLLAGPVGNRHRIEALGDLVFHRQDFPEMRQDRRRRRAAQVIGESGKVFGQKVFGERARLGT